MMARGWESKAIESQQDDARGAKKLARPSPQVDPARRALELARARVLADLERATLPPHRRMLEQALADLDAKLA
jgi:predicted protein tyrosine phosphatase